VAEDKKYLDEMAFFEMAVNAAHPIERGAHQLHSYKKRAFNRIFMFVFKSNHGASHSRINLVTFFQAIKNPQQVRVFYNVAGERGIPLQTSVAHRTRDVEFVYL